MRPFMPILAAVCLCAALRAETVDEKKLLELAQSVETTMTAKDPKVLNSLLDINALVEESTKGIDVPASAKRAFASGMKDNMKLGDTIIQQMGVSGCYKFLRARTVDNKTRLVFRVLLDGSLNYHEYVVSPRGDGLCFTDVYIWASGELMTQTFRRIFLPLAVEANKGLLDKLVSSEELMVKHLPDVQKLVALCKTGKFPEAKAAYEKLPPAVQKDKNVMIFRLRYAMEIGGKEHEDALTAYEQLFPGDAALKLLMIDAELLKKRYDRVLKAINALDAGVGGDPYTHALRANVYSLMGDPAKAKESLAKAIELEPNLAQTYFVGIELAINGKDWAETAKMLTLLEKNTTIELNELETVDFYAEFVKTEEYKKWMEARAKK